MGIEQWWPELEASTRQWLIAHNGEPVPEAVVRDIRRAGGTDAAEVSIGEDGSASLSDDAVDWIEAVANEEQPEPE
ncbi:MAG TPA: hypothetical protein VFS72_05250 [Agromyces sp.]|nr:hypothetical protein [Agromyces sp.]